MRPLRWPFNLYLSLVRPAIFHLRHGLIKQYHHVSGIPAVGTFLVVAGALSGFGGVVSALVGITAMLLDTGGSLQFLLATWGDSSFWDT